MKEMNVKDMTETEESIHDNSLDLNVLEIDENAPSEVKKANDIVEKLNKNQKEAIVKIAEYKFQGPIPHPSILAGYSKIDANLPDRIIKMAEKEQNAAIDHSKEVLRLQGRDVLWGMIFAFTIVIITIVAGVILILNDKDVIGIGTLLTGVGGVVALFFHSNKNDKETK